MDPTQLMTDQETPQEDIGGDEPEPMPVDDHNGSLAVVIHLLDTAGIDVPDASTFTELMQGFDSDPSVAVPVLWQGAKAGDIIICPSTDNAPGNIGICTSDGCQDIATYDDQAQVFDEHLTKGEWISHYEGQMKLHSHLYRPQGDAAKQDQKLAIKQAAHEKANMVEQMAPQIHAQALQQGKQPSEEIGKFLQSQGLSPNQAVLKNLDPPPKPAGPKPYRPKLK